MKRRVSLFLATLAVALALFSACGQTRGAPATARLLLEGSSGRFTTTTGWDVALDEARLVVDALHVFAPAGDRSAALEQRRWRDLRSWIGPSVALAHGGHDGFGERGVRIEWLGPSALDLLAEGPSEIGPMDGSVGVTDEALLAFGVLPEDLARSDGPTRGHHAWISGTASRTREGVTETIAFEGGRDFTVGGTDHLIEAIAADALVEAEGRFHLRFELARWLDQAQFDRLPAGSPATIAPTSQVGIAWDLGLRDPRGILLSYEPYEGEP